jgi:hypothetical protein
VVKVPVSDEDPGEPSEAYARAQDLSLGPLSAVDQEPVIAKANDVGAKAAMNGWSGGRSTKEDELEQCCLRGSRGAGHCTLFDQPASVICSMRART